MKALRGKIHGKTIELDEETGQADGQEVEVQITAISSGRRWGDGIQRTAGALADDPYWDGIMEQVEQARKAKRRPQLDGE